MAITASRSSSKRHRSDERTHGDSSNFFRNAELSSSSCGFNLPTSCRTSSSLTLASSIASAVSARTLSSSLPFAALPSARPSSSVPSTSEPQFFWPLLDPRTEVQSTLSTTSIDEGLDALKDPSREPRMRSRDVYSIPSPGPRRRRWSIKYLRSLPDVMAPAWLPLSSSMAMIPGEPRSSQYLRPYRSTPRLSVRYSLGGAHISVFSAWPCAISWQSTCNRNR